MNNNTYFLVLCEDNEKYRWFSEKIENCFTLLNLCRDKRIVRVIEVSGYDGKVVIKELSGEIGSTVGGIEGRGNIANIVEYMVDLGNRYYKEKGFYAFE